MLDWLTNLLGVHGYTASFCVLLLCGLGLPLPEEVTLLGSGMLVAAGTLDFWASTLVCASAILLGDSIPFLLGRRYGEQATRIPWIARILHPERFDRLRQRFREHGNWATFSLRFLPGIRIPGYFVAGTLGMRFWRFLLLDLVGVTISVPTSIYLGRLFHESIEVLHARMQGLHLMLGFLALSLTLILMAMRQRRQRERS